MTIALGILCKDGAVLAADSQETVQGYWKRRQSKVVAHSFGAVEDLSVVMAGAGRAGYVDALIQQMLDSALPMDGSWHKTIAAFRASLISFHRDHVVSYQSDPPESPLVFAMQKGRHLPMLFVTDRSTLTEVPGNIAAVGIGAGHALSILNRTATEELTLNSAIALAGYVICHTKRHVADCGDETNIVAFRRGKTVWIPQLAIDAMEAEFLRFFETTEPMIVQALIGIDDASSVDMVAKSIRAGRRAILRLAGRRLRPSGVEIVVGSLPSEDK